MALLTYLGTTITDEVYIHEDVNEHIKFRECLPAVYIETYDFPFPVL
jgi:hypothetical protein